MFLSVDGLAREGEDEMMNQSSAIVAAEIKIFHAQ
jgi:hypothetical protein